ncbi:hypothetical protein IV203_025960 [Nitzschia inconspicua]|uniref:Uncharacterized protein n=1 Tax=Nitzschia inconspicua TaxID=303405 RepID=A0A9K3PYZ2_9STRA|nr:hypothetical protein IV203_025960 [Nitzschia inconspicua]
METVLADTVVLVANEAMETTSTAASSEANEAMETTSTAASSEAGTETETASTVDIASMAETFSSLPFGLNPDHQWLREEARNWKCKLLLPAVDEETDAEVNHDLYRYLSERREFQFPATFQCLEAKPRIVMALKLAALKAGFCLVTRTSRPHKIQGTKRMRQLEIWLYCEQAQKRRFQTKSAPTCDTNGLNNVSPQQQPLQARKKTSIRRQLDDSNLCPFRLSIFMISEASSTDGGRWFLSTPKGAPTSTCGCHLGHIQMDPSLLHNYISGLSSRDKQLAKQ